MAHKIKPQILFFSDHWENHLQKGMLYLVGGSPRAGKSTIARKFLSQTGVPYFGLDYLKMGLARGLPEYGVDPNNDDRITAQKLWPVVKGMAMTYVENKEDCLLEGVYLLPEYAAELHRKSYNQKVWK